MENKYIELLLKLLQQSDPYKIILFGSYAKGTANQDSDIDLLVILDNNAMVPNSAPLYSVMKMLDRE